MHYIDEELDGAKLVDKANHPLRCQSNYIVCKHSIRFEYLQCVSVYLCKAWYIFLSFQEISCLVIYDIFPRNNAVIQKQMNHIQSWYHIIQQISTRQSDFFQWTTPVGRLGLSVGIISDKDNPSAKYSITLPRLHFITLNKLLQGSNFISDVSLVCWFISLSGDICISFCQN